VEQEFGPVPVRTIPFFDREMVGVDRLREVGRSLFGDEDPLEVHYRGRPYQVVRNERGWSLRVELPFVTREQVQLSRHGDELVLQAAGWRRTLVLPRALVGARTTRARMEDRILAVEFEPRSAAATAGGARE
ncbi:MAG TPA: hypothetical protein VGK63_12165, partial [Candidatus Limnocylindrales bacterium]